MIFALVFVAWLYIVEYKTTGGRHTPALYFLMYMSALMVVCILLSGQMPFSLAGFFFLAVISAAFWLGHLCSAMVFRSETITNAAPQNGDAILRILEIPFIASNLRVLTAVGAMAGIAALVALWFAAAAAGVAVHSIGDIAQLPAYFSEMRYATGVEDAEPLAVRIFVLVIEAGSISAGLLRTIEGTRLQRLMQYSPLFVSFLMTLMTGVRSYFFLNCTCFFGSFIAILCVRGTVFEQLRSTRFLIKAGIILSIAFLFGSAFSLLRYAAENLQTPSVDQFITQLLPIMASSLAAIVTATLVFDQVSVPGTPLHFAAYTFAPVLAWFGLESYRYPPTVFLSSGLSDSNQYSLAGFLLLDFGPTLTTGIYFVTGALAAAAVYLVRSGVIAMLPFLIGLICVILFSLIHNFFFFTTHVALFIGLTIYWAVLQYLVKQSVPT